ncbi:MAG: aldose 1-epimerase [Halanaerobiales bacterium]|nr:aldose 1-epimerase [Halanaerobiales bacterium]
MEKIIKLKNKNISLEVLPELGASIYSFKIRTKMQDYDIFFPSTQEILKKKKYFSLSSFNLIPYSNRIKSGVLNYNKQKYFLEKNEDNKNAIHGEVFDKNFKVIKKDETSIKMNFDSSNSKSISWPFPFLTGVSYQLLNKGLKICLYVKNTGTEKMPVGMGIHPYLNRYISSNSEKIRADLPLIGYYPGEGQIPNSGWKPLNNKYKKLKSGIFSTEFLDRCFIINPDSDITFHWLDSNLKLTFQVDPIFKHLVIYRPKEKIDFFAVEPVTNANDGFNLAEKGIKDTGFIELEPGERIYGNILLTLGGDLI